MADDSKPRLRDEVAALSGTIRELQDEVARLRVSQTGCACAHVCTHICTHPAYQTWWPPTQIWCNTGAAAGPALTTTSTYTVSL
jgi:hypothetical protein